MGENETVREVFIAALACNTPEARGRYLDEVCRGKPEVRRRVEVLLSVHEQAGDFLESAVGSVRGADSADAGKTIRPDMLPAEKPGDTIGHYKLLQQIGEGGCGVVYMAEQQEPIRRRVAFKVIKLGMDTKPVIARFEAERQALALMDHPNIARVLDAGATETGRPYFVMELVRGQRITDYCDQNNLPTEQRLNLFMQVCHAIQHAHQKGVIHRDIKPSNILVTVVDGQPVPKVIDFGIAKAIGQQLTEKTVFTAFEQFIGTPAYMSPEQTLLSGVDVDTRSDIYSLGVLLYELLTSHTPFDPKALISAGLDEMRRIIREKEPPRPSTRLSALEDAEQTTVAKRRQSEPPKLIHQVRGDLDWIVMKCLEKERGRRYETANALSLDIERHLKQEPVTAAAPNAVYRAGKFIRRHKGGLATVTALALLLVAGVMVSSWQAVRATRAEREQARLREAAQRGQENEARLRQQAEAEKTRADAHAQQAGKEKEIARFNLYVAQISLAQQELENGRVGPALSLLEGQRPKAGEEDLRGFEWYYLWRQCDRGLLATLRGHTQTVAGLAFSPAGTNLVSASPDGTLKSWALSAESESVALVNIPGRISSVAFSRDGKMVACGNTNGVITLWDLSRRTERGQINAHGTWVTCLAFSPDSQRLASAGNNQTLRVWDVNTGDAVGPGWEHQNLVRAITFSPDGQLLAAADYGEIKIYDLATGQLSQTLAGHRWWIKCLAFFPDGKTLVSGGNNETIKFWDLATGKEKTALERAGNPEKLRISPDGTRLALGHNDGTVEVWDLASGQTRFYGHSERVLALAYSPDGNRLASAGLDQAIKLWDLRSPVELPPVNTHDKRVWSVAFSPDGKLFAWGITLRDAATGQELATLSGGEPTFSPDGKTLATSQKYGLALWDTTTWQQRAALKAEGGGMSAVSFAQDSKTLASASWDGKIHLWDVGTGRRLALLEGHPDGQVYSLDFSPDGACLASASGEECLYGEAVLWDVASGQEHARLPRGTTSVAFSPDGKTLVSGLLGGSVGLWDPTTGSARGEISGHMKLDRMIVYSPDGKTLASCNREGSVTLWDTIRGMQRAKLRKGQSRSWSLAFSPDGRTLATGWTDGEVEFWRAADEHEVTGPSRPSDRQIELAGQSGWQAVVLQLRGRNAEARDAYLNAVALYESAATEHPEPSECKRGLAVTYSRLLKLVADSSQLATNDCSRALTWADKALALTEGQTNVLPLAEIAAIYCIKGRSLEKANRVQEAMAAFTRAIELAAAETKACAALLQEARLRRGSLLRRMGRLAEAADDCCQALNMPRREDQTKTNLVDLSPFYNADPKQTWGGGGRDKSLAALPTGIQTLAGTEFDVRGLIQLAGVGLLNRGKDYPASVADIPIRRKFARLHVLQGAIFGQADATRVGAFVLHYADGRELNLPIVYGADVLDWWQTGQSKEATQATVAWTGLNPTVSERKVILRLFKRTWDNPRPEVEVKSIDFTSTMTLCSPFLIALTVE